MSVEIPEATATSSSAPETCPGVRPIRVAVICDFLEENWPSMDLNGDMLHHFLAKDHTADIAPTQVRPPFQRRFARIPLFPEAIERNADRLLNRFVDYPRRLRTQLSHFDLFHLVDHSYAQLVHYLPPERTIVTCHDLDTFRCLLEPEQENRSRWFKAMSQRILRGFRQAAHVICNSNATRDQLLRYNLFPSERITVIHSGVHPAFAALPDAAADAEAVGLLQTSSPGDIRLLSVGSTIARKRIDVLLRVFASVLKGFPTARLVRVGGPFTDAQVRLARELGVEESILVLPFIGRDVLAAIYRRVTLLLQTSEAEGFGMPLAEAMACGCPVVASDLTVLREIGGTVCVYCPMGDIDHWTSAVAGVLRENAEQDGGGEFRRQQALAQVARYSWAENARQTVKIYEAVLGRKGNAIR
jgi:glycosyltransferase involved in cell wall biosynthesis